MPFPDEGAVVALGFEKGGNGGALGCDEAGRVALDDSFLVLGAPAVATGEEAVSSGGADGGAGVGIGENHAFFGEAIDGRGGDFTTLGIEALDVAVAEVITEDEDDVGLLWSRNKSLSNEESAQESFRQDGFHFNGFGES